jgi:hypothetical protein
MSKEGTVYNYSFCDTSLLGQYIINGITDVDGIVTNWGYDFDVTKSGSTISEAESNISTSTIYFLLFLGSLLIVFGLFVLDRGFWMGWVGVFAMIVGFILLYYDLSLVNYYVGNITLSGSTAGNIFNLVSRFIKLLPYITWLIVGFAVIRIFKAVRTSKNSVDGWDSNKY